MRRDETAGEQVSQRLEGAIHGLAVPEWERIPENVRIVISERNGIFVTQINIISAGR